MEPQSPLRSDGKYLAESRDMARLGSSWSSEQWSMAGICPSIATCPARMFYPLAP